MSLTTQVDSYNSSVKSKIPEWGSGYPKLGLVTVVCILFSFPLYVFDSEKAKDFIKEKSKQEIMNDSTEDIEENVTESLTDSSPLFIFSLLSRANFFGNTTGNFTKELITILIYVINILYEALFWKSPNDIETLSLYQTSFYNLNFNISVENFGWFNVGLILFKNMVLQKQGLDSLFFGMVSGNKQSYLASLNFWNALGMAYYYKNRISPEYDTFYNSLDSEATGLGDVYTAITVETVQDNLYYYLKKVSNMSIPASAGLYFTLLEIIESQKNSSKISSNIDSQNIAGGNPNKRKKKKISNWPNEFSI
jgi:hypothetical protein